MLEQKFQLSASSLWTVGFWISGLQWAAQCREQWQRNNQLETGCQPISRTSLKISVKIREFIVLEPGKYILSPNARARNQIDSQKLKYTFPSPTLTVSVTWNSEVFQGSLGPTDKALYMIPSQASLKAMTILYWWHQGYLQDLKCSAGKNFKSQELGKSINPFGTLNIQTPIFLGDKSEMSHSVSRYEFRTTLMKPPAIISTKKERPSDHLSYWHVLLGIWEQARGFGCPCHHCYRKPGHVCGRQGSQGNVQETNGQG